jgi:lipopolysaccharide assembly outer membrane protein LptD (OstA)
MKYIALALLLLPAAARAADREDFMMGSVVKSEKWTMDRAADREIFDGNVSFRNPKYVLKADHALYDRKTQAWDITGSVYILRTFDDKSVVEANCDSARYLEGAEEAYMDRGLLPVRMKHTGADGKVLNGRSDKAKAENRTGLMRFTGNFALSTENLDIFSSKGLYDRNTQTFLIEESTPLAVGKREGYDFAINSEKIKFFRDSRDIKFYNNVTGWVKDNPEKPFAAK